MSKKKATKKRTKKATKRKKRSNETLPTTITVSVSTTFVVRDLIQDAVEGYADWDDDIEAHKADVDMNKLIDIVLECAYEAFGDKIEEYYNLILTDEHGQIIRLR